MGEFDRLHTPDVREKARKKYANCYKVNDKVLYGAHAVYEYLVHDMHYYLLTEAVVSRLLNQGKLTKAYCEQYPLIDPDNPNKIWKCISVGSTSAKSRTTSGYIPKRISVKYGIVFMADTSEGNRLYSFTTKALNKAIMDLEQFIASGACELVKSTDDLKYYVIGCETITDGTDKVAYEHIENLITTYESNNIGKSAINLMNYLN